MPSLRHSIPDAYRKARRSAGPQGGVPRVVTGFSAAYGPFGGGPQRVVPTDLALIAAYRNATYVCASYKAEGLASQALRLYATTSSAKGEKALRCRTKALSPAQERYLGSVPAVSKRLSGVDRVDEVTEHPIISILDSVNPWMNRSQLFELTQLYLDVAGKYFWFLVRGLGGVPVQIWPLPAWMVYVQPDFAGNDVVENYIFTGGGGQAILDKENVLFGRELSLVDPYTQGYGALKANYELAAIYDKNTAYRDATLDNRGRPDAMLVPNEEGGELTVDPDAIARIQAEYEQSFAYGRAGKLWVPPGGLKLQPVNWSPVDMGEIAQQKGVLHDIARAFKVPIALVDGESATRASMDASLLAFARFCLKPACRKLEEHLNSNFVPLWDDRLFLAFDDPVPADKVAEREENIAYVKEGIRTRGEIRASTGDLPMEGDDVLLVPSGYVPLSHAIKPPEPPPAMGAKPGGKFGKEPTADDLVKGDDEAFAEGDDVESGAAGKAWGDEDRRHFRGPWDGVVWPGSAQV